MGKLDPNTLIGILRGKIGNLVFSESKQGKVTVRHRPIPEFESIIFNWRL